MSDWDLIRERILHLAGDPPASRYTDALVCQAGLLALQTYGETLPRIKTLTLDLTEPVEEVLLTDAPNLMAVLSVNSQPSYDNLFTRAFTWSRSGEMASLQFCRPLSGRLCRCPGGA